MFDGGKALLAWRDERRGGRGVGVSGSAWLWACIVARVGTWKTRVR
jgi:hypothetical protein